MTDAKTIPFAGLGDIRHFLDAKACRAWLLGRLHPCGAACPTCGTKLTNTRHEARFWELETVRCQKCQRSFNALSGTAFHRIQLAPVDIVAMLLLLRYRRGTAEIAGLLGVNERTARRWQKRFQAHGADFSHVAASTQGEPDKKSTTKPGAAPQ